MINEYVWLNTGELAICINNSFKLNPQSEETFLQVYIPVNDTIKIIRDTDVEPVMFQPGTYVNDEINHLSGMVTGYLDHNHVYILIESIKQICCININRLTAYVPADEKNTDYEFEVIDQVATLNKLSMNKTEKIEEPDNLYKNSPEMQQLIDDEEKFNELMRIPLCEIPDSALEWAYGQDRFNSAMSKMIWHQEIQRRKRLP